MRSLLIRPTLPKILPSFKGPGPGICQIQLQWWWGWSITMMFAMMMPAMIVMLTMMMNTNGNDWWWGQQGLVSLFGAQMYFPSLFIIFPKSETANSKYSKYNVTANSSFTKWSKYNMFPSTGANLDRKIWDWCHLCLYQVMMIMVMVVTNMLIMEIQMMTKMTLMRQTRGNVWFLSFCLQSIINHQNTIGSNQQHCLSQDPALRLRLPSSWPGYYDYERMVNDDNFAVYCLSETVCVSECLCAGLH